MLTNYEIIGLKVEDGKPCLIEQPGMGRIDLKTIDDEKAKALIAKKCPYLREKVKQPFKEAKPTSS